MDFTADLTIKQVENGLYISQLHEFLKTESVATLSLYNHIAYDIGAIDLDTFQEAAKILVKAKFDIDL